MSFHTEVKDDDGWWKEISHAWRKANGFLPMTAAEADKAYDESPAIPMSKEEIQKIVDYVVSRDKELS